MNAYIIVIILGTSLLSLPPPPPQPFHCQAFSQKGVQVSFEHSIADFGHPNIFIFCVYKCNGMKKNTGHPIHTK